MSETTVPATTQKNELTQIQSLRATINSPAVKNRFEEMLGKRSASFLSSLVSAVSTNKQLALAEPGSVVTAAAMAASLDLPINPSLGFAHIVPYKPKNSQYPVAQFQMGWKGFVQLALRSGQYRTINVVPVKEGQIKKQNSFTGEMEFQEEATGPKVIGYLLFFKLINGYEKYFYMTHAESEAHGRRYSQSFKKGYGLWVDNFEAMALKTVVKLGLSKYGILSVEMQKAIEADQSVIREDGSTLFPDNDAPETTEADVTPKETLADKLKNQKVEPVKVEKTDLQIAAGNVEINFWADHPPVKICDIPENELLAALSEIEAQSHKAKLLKGDVEKYETVCTYLNRQRNLKTK